MVKFSLLSLIVLSLVIGGCDAPPADQVIKEMKFAIDSSLIDPSYTNQEYGFTFSPPIHYAPFSAPELDTFRQDAEKLQSGTRPVKSNFITVFGDSLTRGMLIVSEILDGDSKNMKSADYDGVLKSNTDSSKVTAHKFLKGGKTVYLYVTRDETYFSYLIFFEAKEGKLVQINYQIPADVNLSFSGAIESSIGTLKF